VTKTLHVETEAKTEAAGFETESEAKTVASETEVEVEAEAVYLETEAEAQGSWSVFLADRTNGRASATVLRPSVCL